MQWHSDATSSLGQGAPTVELPFQNRNGQSDCAVKYVPRNAFVERAPHNLIIVLSTINNKLSKFRRDTSRI